MTLKVCGDNHQQQEPALLTVSGVQLKYCLLKDGFLPIFCGLIYPSHFCKTWLNLICISRFLCTCFLHLFYETARLYILSPGDWIYFLFLESNRIFENFPSKRNLYTVYKSNVLFWLHSTWAGSHQSAPNSTISFQCPVKIIIGLNLLSLKYLEYLPSLSPSPEYLKN